MKYVGVREFRDNATRYLASDEVLAVERHGRPIGFYIPVASTPDEERQHRVAQLSKAVARLLTESGMSEEELASVLDLHNPAPTVAVAPATHAPGR